MRTSHNATCRVTCKLRNSRACACKNPIADGAAADDPPRVKKLRKANAFCFVSKWRVVSGGWLETALERFETGLELQKIGTRSRDSSVYPRQLSKWFSYFGSHFGQETVRSMCSSRPSGVVTQGRSSQGGRWRMCCVWPHERSATRSPDSS